MPVDDSSFKVKCPSHILYSGVYVNCCTARQHASKTANATARFGLYCSENRVMNEDSSCSVPILPSASMLLLLFVDEFSVVTVFVIVADCAIASAKTAEIIPVIIFVLRGSVLSAARYCSINVVAVAVGSETDEIEDDEDDEIKFVVEVVAAEVEAAAVCWTTTSDPKIPKRCECC